MDKRRKRAVAYVRVSTASSAQLHSYEFQEQYWHDKLDSDPNVELIHIYADLGSAVAAWIKDRSYWQ